jgi:hypothetical protein
MLPCGTRDVVSCALYHRPSPIHKTKALLDYSKTSQDDTAIRFADVFVALAGNLDTLSLEDIVARTAFNPINRPEVSMRWIASIRLRPATEMKSDHKAHVAYTGEQMTSIIKKKKRTYRWRLPAEYSVFLGHIAGLKIELANTDDTQANFDLLCAVLLGLLDCFYLERTITVTSSDPP